MSNETKNYSLGKVTLNDNRGWMGPDPCRETVESVDFKAAETAPPDGSALLAELNTRGPNMPRRAGKDTG